MAVVGAVYGKEHRTLKRRILTLSFLDLIFITATVVFVVMQLVSIGLTYTSSNGSQDVTNNSRINSDIDSFKLEDKLTTNQAEDDDYSDPDMYPVEHEHNHNHNHNHNHGAKPLSLNNNESKGCNTTLDGDNCHDDKEDDDGLLYRSVIGARISLSIQLIIYIAQLGFGVLLCIATYYNDSRNLHLWILFSEVIVVVICLGLFINFFGKFLWTVVVITGVYIVFKIFLIKLVRRFIHVNDLELTQFGSVGEFE